MVVLKPLSRALADGDPIYAVIRGGAINQDGRTNGLTAPSRSAQEAVLRAAYRQAGVSPGQVDYIEAHGTGTLLGDPIELGALGAVLAEGRDAGPEMCPGLGQDEHRPPRGRGRGRRADQDGAGASPPGDSPEPAFLPAEPPRRLRCPAAPSPVRPRSLARQRAAGARGRQLVRVRREPTRTWSSRRPRFAAIVVPLRRRRSRPEEVVIPLSAKSPAALWDLARSFRDCLVRRLLRTGPPRPGLHGRRTARAPRPPAGARRLQPGRDRRGPGLLPARRAALEQRPRAKAPGTPSRTGLRILRSRRPLAGRRPRAVPSASPPSAPRSSGATPS